MTAPVIASPAAHAPSAAPLWLRLAPALFLVLWSGGFVVGKIGVQYAEPFTLLTVRYLLVFAVLVPVFLAMRPPLPKRLSEWGHLCAVGLMLQAGYFCFCYAAFAAGASAGTVALIVSLQPIAVALLAPVLVGEGRITATRWLGLALGLLGAALVIFAKSGVELTSLLGVMLAVGAFVSLAGGTLWEKRFGVAHHPVTANTIQYAVGLAVTLPLTLALEDMHIEWTGELIAALAYLVLANSLLAVTLLLAMVRRGEASRVSALFFLVPAVSALMAFVLLDETLPPLGWVGMVVAALGVALASQKQPQGVSEPNLVRQKEKLQ
jgi:drug/metabolite transporter (DMT)-like permease